MSRYRLIHDGELPIPSFQTTDTQISTQNNIIVTPPDPVAKTIPSFVNNTANTTRSSSVYGPTTRRYESLRYYGNGGY